MNTPKHIHFIGICGVGMGALAIMMKKKGHKVTGSDVGFYPPISTHLQENNIEYYAGWHTEQVGTPDLVVVGNVAGSENPEWKLVQENKIPFVSYPELIARELVRKNSIVCAGTYGKTSTSALLAWILINAGKNPAYMFGGLSQTPALASEDLGGDWSVLEGDEYKTARWDNSPKFSHYSPTHLLLTAVKWDHADVYPTEASYFEAFKNLVKSVPKSGVIVVSERTSEMVKLSNCQTVIYGKSPTAIYQFSNLTVQDGGLQFQITHQSKTYNLTTNLLGSYMVDNLCAAFAMAHQIGIEPEVIVKAIESFKGIKRRLEKRFEGDITVIDDIAHSPAKARSVLETLREIYLGKIPRSARNDSPRVVAIFEPNTGNRQIESIPSYDNQFIAADEVIIPRLTQIKRDPNKSEPMDGAKLTEVISKTHSNVKYIDDDNILINYLSNKLNPGDVVVFLGSHGFRGMIDELVKGLKSLKGLKS